MRARSKRQLACGSNWVRVEKDAMKAPSTQGALEMFAAPRFSAPSLWRKPALHSLLCNAGCYGLGGCDVRLTLLGERPHGT